MALGLVVTAPLFTRRREDLRHAVDELAEQLATGAIRMDVTELEALAQICAEHFLPVEAARVRRWKAGLRKPAFGGGDD